MGSESTLTVIPQEQANDFAKAGEMALQQANKILVEDDDKYAAVAETLKFLKAQRAKVLDFTKPTVEAAFKAHKAAKALQNNVVKPYDETIRIYSAKLGAYQAECERQRQAEERRLLAERQKKADDRALEEAEALEEKGLTEAAEAVIVSVPPQDAKVRPFAPKVTGTAVRTNWKFRIVNRDEIPRSFMVPDEKAIGVHVRSHKSEAKIPGVEIYPETSVS